MKICYFPNLDVVYYCIDKCASTTLFQALADHAQSDPEIYWDAHCTQPSTHEQHEYVLRSSTAVHFAFVRNPWDRALALYAMLRHQDQVVHPVGHLHPWFARHEAALLKRLRGEAPFEGFLNYICGMSEREMDSHWSPQYAGIPVARPDFFVGRFECLQEDFNRLCERIGAEEFELPVLNNTPHEHYSTYYTDETRELVAGTYQRDIELFGYEF